ncbi:MAG: FAD-binding domain-containing protein [Cyanobacteria bacterium P01_F01_bin.150]
MSELIFFWHRRDLRISDNAGLHAAWQKSSKVVGVFCLDPNILGRDDIAPVRLAYMLESLRELQQSYLQAGSQLLVLRDDPINGLSKLAQELGATQIYWNQDVEPYARQRDRAVSEALEAVGVESQVQWDQLLHAPGEIRTGAGKPYTVYTPFWKNWNKQIKPAPYPAPTELERLSQDEQERAVTAGSIPLPTFQALAKDLNIQWDGEFILSPGERAAHTALESFCRERGGVCEYDEQRNFPAIPGTSTLSPALKFGTVGIRTVWDAAQQVMATSRSDETRTNIETWQKELAWREFYQHALYFFPELAEGPYREPFKDFPWINNEIHFQAWCKGETGYPIVDAAMRQLNQTGWMHNRCRMIVASFLTKDLIIDWRWGEKYFMQTLIDGDLAANNGGWQWSASSGMDPKPLRIFNPASQAKKFDQEADYIRRWIPELKSVSAEALVTGKISKAECDRYDYSSPVVDHGERQRLFKQLYKSQKERLG